jgi:phosphatidylethanolamine-binding protein (PEBP) family uncharacterized protein
MLTIGVFAGPLAATQQPSAQRGGRRRRRQHSPSPGFQLPEGVPKGPTLANGAFQMSATGAMYRGPGAGATGPKHHYMFEVYALDVMLDVKPAADAFETRTSIMKAIQGHVLGKAVYGGLFRRPPQ